MPLKRTSAKRSVGGSSPVRVTNQVTRGADFTAIYKVFIFGKRARGKGPLAKWLSTAPPSTDSAEKARALSLRAAARVALAEPGGDVNDAVDHALRDIESAVKLAAKTSMDEALKGETFAWRGLVRHRAAKLLPDQYGSLLKGALADLDKALNASVSASKEQVAMLHVERAQVRLAFAEAGGATIDSQVLESVEEYRAAVDTLLASQGTEANVDDLEAKAPWVSGILAVRQAYGLNRSDFATLLEYSERRVADWETGKVEPGSDVERRYEELRRLHDGLSTIIRPKSISAWLAKENPAFGGRAPMELIRQGKNDLLWQMIFQLRASPSL